MKILYATLLFFTAQIFSADLSENNRFDALDLPELGSEQQNTLTPSKKFAISYAIYSELLRQNLIVYQPEVLLYLDLLGKSLKKHTDLEEDVYVHLIKDESLNAFATPGHFIAINTGLLKASESTDELAAVLAHEIAHLQQKHVERLIEESKGRWWQQLVAMAGSIALSAVSPQAAQAALVVSQASDVQIDINTIRKHEREADHIAIELLEKSGFKSTALPDFFNKMQKVSMGSRDNIPKILLTHPVSHERMAAAYARIQPISAPPASAQPFWQTWLDYIKAWLNGKSGTPLPKHAPTNHTFELINAEEMRLAEECLTFDSTACQRLIKRSRLMLWSRMIAAKYLMKQKNASACLRILQPHQQLSELHPLSREYFQTMSSCYYQLGKSIFSEIFRAKWLVASGELKQALQVLRHLKNNPGLTTAEQVLLKETLNFYESVEKHNSWIGGGQ